MSSYNIITTKNTVRSAQVTEAARSTGQPVFARVWMWMWMFSTPWDGYSKLRGVVNTECGTKVKVSLAVAQAGGMFTSYIYSNEPVNMAFSRPSPLLTRSICIGSIFQSSVLWDRCVCMPSVRVSGFAPCLGR